jgi:hypothetical protein
MNAPVPHATIGHNRPPVDIFEERIVGLFDEAKNWLDGEPVTAQAQADELGKLLDMIRTAAKEADAQRKVEKKPYDDAAKAVQDAWNPLLKRCEIAADTVKKALAPFLAEQDRIAREAAAAARREAEEKAAAARAAFQASDVTDLSAREEAERLAREAKDAEKIAGKAEKVKAGAQGGARAVSLRTVYAAQVTDYQALARHVWTTDPEALRAFLDEYAAAATRRSPDAARALPGVTVTESKVAV